MRRSDMNISIPHISSSNLYETNTDATQEMLIQPLQYVYYTSVFGASLRKVYNAYKYTATRGNGAKTCIQT